MLNKKKNTTKKKRGRPANPATKLGVGSMGNPKPFNPKKKSK
jgi:hypothetical protein